MRFIVFQISKDKGKYVKQISKKIVLCDLGEKFLFSYNGTKTIFLLICYI